MTCASAAEPSCPWRPPTKRAARAVVDRLASELLSNPLIEAYAVEPLGAASSAVSAGAGEG